MNPRLFHLQLYQRLRLLRDQSLHLGFIVGTFRILFKLLLHVVSLLHQRLHGGMLLLHDRFHLGALGVAQI